jgi:hypothetical protein
MAIVFPDSPTNGQLYNDGYKTWQWSSTTSTWDVVSLTTGVSGPTGVQGVIGIIGNQGTTGLQGTVVGAQGPTGLQGTVTGAQGITGLQGAQGIQGNIVGPTTYSTYNNTLFVTLQGLTTTALYSTDAITWNVTTLPVSGNFYNFAYGNGKWVAVQVGGQSAISSTDGITWTANNLTVSGAWVKTAYGNGRFVTMLATTTTANWSTDGITWSLSTLASSIQWQGIAFGAGGFVIISYTIPTTTSNISTDGVTWTITTLPNAVSAQTIVWSSYANKYIVIPGTSAGSSLAAYSTNGITWTSTSTPLLSSPNHYWDIAAGHNGVVAISNLAAGSTAATYSSDGITWSVVTMPASLVWNAISYGQGIYIATTVGSTTVGVSTDGTTWTVRSITASSGWTGGGVVPFYNPTTPILTKTAPYQPVSVNSYTVGVNEKYVTLRATATTTITLPNPGAYPGREITIMNTAAFAVNSSISNVYPLGSTTIGTAILAATAGKFARLVSNGQTWITMEAN